MVKIIQDYKKYGAQKRSELVSMCFLFLVYMIIYAFTLAFGGMSKSKKWEKVQRNTGNKNGK